MLDNVKASLSYCSNRLTWLWYKQERKLETQQRNMTIWHAMYCELESIHLEVSKEAHLCRVSSIPPHTSPSSKILNASRGAIRMGNDECLSSMVSSWPITSMEAAFWQWIMARPLSIWKPWCWNLTDSLDWGEWISLLALRKETYSNMSINYDSIVIGKCFGRPEFRGQTSFGFWLPAHTNWTTCMG